MMMGYVTESLAYLVVLHLVFEVLFNEERQSLLPSSEDYLDLLQLVVLFHGLVLLHTQSLVLFELHQDFPIR